MPINSSIVGWVRSQEANYRTVEFTCLLAWFLRYELEKGLRAVYMLAHQKYDSWSYFEFLMKIWESRILTKFSEMIENGCWVWNFSILIILPKETHFFKSLYRRHSKNIDNCCRCNSYFKQKGLHCERGWKNSKFFLNCFFTFLVGRIALDCRLSALGQQMEAINVR